MAKILEKRDLVFLHGFLGLPSDGHFLKSLTGDWNFHFLDYFNDPNLGLGPEKNFSEWSLQFLTFLNSLRNPVVVGYSLGGRLALNTFMQREFPLLMISCRWGIEDPQGLGADEYSARLKSDLKWQEDFKNLEWNELMKKWNQQIVFQGTQNEPLRLESNYSREKLALSLKNWGLSMQADCSGFIQKNNWVYMIGANDLGYVERSKQKLGSFFNKDFFVVPNSGHRIIFDQPEFIIQNFPKKFISEDF